MNVRIEIMFQPPTEEDHIRMRAIATSLTREPQTIRVLAHPEKPTWLVAEFTMPTAPQFQAVEEVDRMIRLFADQHLDSTISFPRTPAEEARAKRKNEQAKMRRRSRRESGR